MLRRFWPFQRAFSASVSKSDLSRPSFSSFVVLFFRLLEKSQGLVPITLSIQHCLALRFLMNMSQRKPDTRTTCSTFDSDPLVALEAGLCLQSGSKRSGLLLGLKAGRPILLAGGPGAVGRVL